MAAVHTQRAVVWMRRALRVKDNLALWLAHQHAEEVVPLVFLREEPKYRLATPRRRFFQAALADLDAGLRKLGTQLHVCFGGPEVALPLVVRAYGANAVYAVQSFDPRIRDRDRRLAGSLAGIGVAWHDVPDTVQWESRPLATGAGTPFRVFTPFKRAWLRNVLQSPVDPLPALNRLHGCPVMPPAVGLDNIPAFAGAERRGGESAARERLSSFVRDSLALYASQRDYPAVNGTSRLSAHLAHGTISVRTILHALRSAADAGTGGEVFLTELIWREFYYHVLASYPRVVDGPFKEQYAGLPWRNDEAAFAAWAEGRTGYPIVDAGMRQLKEEGWMHNRVRMISASFLTKDLHIDWRRGERHFFDTLVDADLASNNGGWQWSAGTGTDSPPFFRVFNPVLQGKRYDGNGEYIRRYVAELARVPAARIHEPWNMTREEQRKYGCTPGTDYPFPIVDHRAERMATLELLRKRIGSVKAEEMKSWQV